MTAKFSVTRPRNIVFTFLEVNAQRNPSLRSWCLSYNGFFYDCATPWNEVIVILERLQSLIYSASKGSMFDSVSVGGCTSGKSIGGRDKSRTRVVHCSSNFASHFYQSSGAFRLY